MFRCVIIKGREAVLPSERVEGRGNIAFPPSFNTVCISCLISSWE